MINYYPPTLSIAQIRREIPEWSSLVDEAEQQRLQDIEDRKKRGKGAPKKAKSKGALISCWPSCFAALDKTNHSLCYSW